MKMKQIMLLIAFGVALFAALTNLTAVIGFAGMLVQLVYPVLLGMLLAFILNVPMRAFERLLRYLFGKSADKIVKLIHALSLLLSLASVILVLVLVVTMLLPEIISSVNSIIALVQKRIPDWIALLNNYDIDTTGISNWISGKLTKLDMESLIQQLGNGAGSVISSVAGIAASTVSAVANAGFAVIIAIYILVSKRDLSRQGKKLLYAHLKPSLAGEICRVMNLIMDTYCKFFSGQCLEALILGTLILLAFTAMKLPYASLIAVLTSVCALIPYVGAFVSFTIGTVLTLLADPSHVLLCVIVYLVVQFVENQIIYPHVVGSSVGLSPLWTLVAAILGGKLFGIVGVVLFIPMVAVVQQLLGEDTDRRLQEKNIRIS